VLQHDELADLDPGSRRLELRSLVVSEVPATDVADVLEELVNHVDGFGPLAPLMNDETVTDIVINGPFEVWVDRGSCLERSDLVFEDETELLELIERLMGEAGGRVDPVTPIADVRLPDGSRFHVVLPPVAPRGPLVSIRRFPVAPFDLDSLQSLGMFDRREADLFRGLLGDRQTILISGATGSGKTTLLNALLSEIPADERVVLIEETSELRPVGAHAVSLLVRRPSIEGTGGIDQDALLKAALRMRPDRIVVGEVRGAESLTALAAMSTGHRGSMASIHASSPAHATRRLVSLALQAKGGPGEAALEAAVSDAIDAVVHLERRGGVRRVEEIVLA
jgi:pilus assembly protein CpaF